MYDLSGQRITAESSLSSNNRQFWSFVKKYGSLTNACVPKINFKVQSPPFFEVFLINQLNHHLCIGVRINHVRWPGEDKEFVTKKRRERHP